jgi:hypothetical protein
MSIKTAVLLIIVTGTAVGSSRVKHEHLRTYLKAHGVKNKLLAEPCNAHSD